MPDGPPIFCPECGAPAPFRGTAVSLVCEYCGSTIVRTDADVQLIGKVSAVLDNGSPIVLDSRGRWNSVPFEVVGRLQVRYERGTWNEWFLNFVDGTIGWLADAQGSFSIVTPRDPSTVAGRVPTYHQIAINSVMHLEGTELVVVDKKAASYQGAEGVLPFAAEPGLEFHSVDLRGFRGEFMTLDYGTSGNHTSPVPYTGSAVDLEAIGLRPLRRYEGWRD
jgi:hypothetical protein